MNNTIHTNRNNLFSGKMENIKSDTTMRDSIADTGSESSAEENTD